MTSPTSPIISIEIPEYEVNPAQRLGRHILHDPRSWDHRPETAPQIVDALHASFGLPLNQGNVGDCTANAWIGCANSMPNWTDANVPAIGRSKPGVQADCITLYTQETGDEGQPYPQYDPGGSGLAVCRAARELGWLKRWANAFTLDEALRSLVVRPVITGINWYDSFDQPDGNGLVSISSGAQVRGGHEVLVNQIFATDQVIGLWNSWGPGWGVGGRFFMSWTTWDQLLSEQGDVTVPAAAVAR